MCMHNREWSNTLIRTSNTNRQKFQLQEKNTSRKQQTFPKHLTYHTREPFISLRVTYFCIIMHPECNTPMSRRCQWVSHASRLQTCQRVIHFFTRHSHLCSCVCVCVYDHALVCVCSCKIVIMYVWFCPNLLCNMYVTLCIPGSKHQLTNYGSSLGFWSEFLRVVLS